MASVDWTFYWWLRLKESTRRPFSRHSFHSWKCKSPERTELPSTWQLHYSQSWVFKSQPYAKCLKAQLPSPPPPQKKNLQRLRSSFGVDLLSPILSCRVLSLIIFPYLHWGYPKIGKSLLPISNAQSILSIYYNIFKRPNQKHLSIPYRYPCFWLS